MTGVYEGHHNNMFIAIAPDAYVVAISMGRSIGVFDSTTGQLEEMLENVHSGESFFFKKWGYKLGHWHLKCLHHGQRSYIVVLLDHLGEVSYKESRMD